MYVNKKPHAEQDTTEDIAAPKFPYEGIKMKFKIIFKTTEMSKI